MTFEQLIDKVGHLPAFDFATVTQLFGGQRDLIRTKLYRWTKSGKLSRLRRGVYTLSDRYRRCDLCPNIKTSLFFGYTRMKIRDRSFLMNSGEWTEGRLTSMRFQNIEDVETSKLTTYAQQHAACRIDRALESWARYAAAVDVGVEI